MIPLAAWTGMQHLLGSFAESLSSLLLALADARWYLCLHSVVELVAKLDERDKESTEEIMFKGS